MTGSSQLKVEDTGKQVTKPKPERREFWDLAFHDLRAPLTVIIGSAQFLMSRAADRDRELVQMILRSAEDMLRLMEDLLTIEQIRSNRISLDRQAQNLLPVLERSLEDYHRTAQDKGIEIEYRGGADDVSVLIDAEHIKAVFDNLLSNAIKFSRPGTEITVSTAVVDGYIQVSVKDQGVGIQQDEMDELFMEFAKLTSRPTADESGTGLGLAIARKLVELHGGNVTASSIYGAGSTFTVNLPILEEAPEAALQQEEALIIAPAETEQERPSYIGPITALLIDDSQGTRRILATMLESLGLEVIGEAFDGKTGLDRYRELKPDVVFLDIVMPVMSGVEVLRRIRKINPEAIVVILTALASSDKILESKEQGAFAYLLKPFEDYKIQKVVNEIKAIIQKGS